MDYKRVIVWFSCGATSAVAGKLALKDYDLPVDIVYCDTGSEHPDNKRFLKDCEDWYNQEIIILKSEKYNDIWEVFEKTRYLAGINGARCTTELKKKLRHEYQSLDDIQIFGFDTSELKRAERFRNNNPEIRLDTPLITHNLTKQDCKAIIAKAGIELPAMYKLGYKNNNCIGCVKGQSGYWNKIRKDFPSVFQRMADIEIELNVALNKSYAGDGKRKRIFLKDLPPDAGRYSEEEDISCGLLCDSIYNEYIEECET